jgi:hypothetical protein
MLRLTTLLLFVRTLAACTSQAQDQANGADKAPKGGDTSSDITENEVGQGMALCLGYMTRVCKCAETDAAFKEECELARGRPEALKMVVRILGGTQGPISTTERREQEAGARKIVKACVRADGALDPAKCPRY